MEIKRSGSQPSGKGPAEYFTGSVSVDSLFRHPLRHAWSALLSRSSPALGQHGTRIRWAKR